MTLKSLEYFKKLAELQHFTKAANELHISQPSLSYAISELEKDLEIPLFDRKDKKISLNYYGEVFLSYVNQSLSILDEGINFVKHISNPKAKNISVGYIQSLSSSIIPPFIEEFYKNPLNKNIQFSFTQKDNNELIKIFLDRKLDEARDTYRKTVLGDNRLAEFNRFENTIYENTLERRADLNLSNDNETYRAGFGKTTSEIWSREGLFDGTYRKYENKSKFYEVQLGRQNLPLGDIGTFGIDGTFRQDKFDASSDKTNLLNLKLDNDLFLYLLQQ